MIRASQWSVLISGGTTFLFLAVFQWRFSAFELGSLGTLMAPYSISLALSRAVGSQTLLRGRSLRSDVGLARIYGLILAGCCVGTGLISVFVAPAEWSVLVVVWVGLGLVEDVFRYRAIGVNMGRLALIADLVWLVAFLGVLCVLWLRSGSLSPTLLVGSFGAGAGASVLVCGCLWRGLASYSRRTPPSISLLADALMAATFVQGSVLVLGARGELDAVGLYRSAQTVMMPITMLASLVIVGRFPDLDVEDATSLGAQARRVCMGMSLLALVWGASLGVFGAAVPYVSSFVSPAAVVAGTVFGVGCALSAGCGLMWVKIRLDVRPSAWLLVRGATGLIDPILGVWLGIKFGGVGMSIGFAVAYGCQFLACLIWISRRR